MSLRFLLDLDNNQKVASTALEAIANSIPSGIIIVAKTDEKIVYVNKRFEEITGFNPKGLTLKEYALNMAKVRKIDNSPFLYKQLPLTQALFFGKTIRNQEILIHKSNKSKLTALVNAKPLIEDGNIVGAIAVFEDVTEYRRAEGELKQAQIRLQEHTNDLEQLVEARTEKIRESEEKYRELYENFGEAFIGTDWEMNVTQWNKATEKITSVPAKNALGKKVYEVMPEMLSIDFAPYLETLQQRKPVRFMMNVTSRETKKPSIFEVSTYPSTNGIIIIVEDKTEEEETKRLSTIGQVAGMVGHDIRNPLQAILSDVYLLKEQLKAMPEMQTKNEVTESLNGISENVEYVSKIVADLQDFVKPLNPNIRQIDLETILDNVLVKKAVAENIQVSKVIQKEAKRLISDPDLLKRALTNLVNNAIQAMPNGGKLIISAIYEKGNIIITVEDSGVGIPENVRDRLFTPLFTTKSKGQGFGLSVVKRISESLGGTICFESKVGKGTKFIMRLPQQSTKTSDSTQQ